MIDDDMDIQPFRNLSIDLFLRKWRETAWNRLSPSGSPKAEIIGSGAISNPIREAFYAAD
ncbi:hypothetical protein [Bradyrhizobium australiense]|uniref:hypothetical protein n=1 Tax=Bradyrhizobium australiense TaxID=2721161 RepID=UPI0035DB8788